MATQVAPSPVIGKDEKDVRLGSVGSLVDEEEDEKVLEVFHKFDIPEQGFPIIVP